MTEGVTIRLCVQDGRVIVYASFIIPNPNSAFNHFILDAIFHRLNCQDLYVNASHDQSLLSPYLGNEKRKKRQESVVERFLFVSVEGIASISRFTLETTTGNTTQSTVLCTIVLIHCLAVLFCYSADTVTCQSMRNPCGSDIHLICRDDPIGYSCSCVSGYTYNTQQATCDGINTKINDYNCYYAVLY